MTGVEEINGNCYWTATYCDLFVFDHHFITHLQCFSMKAVKKKIKKKNKKNPPSYLGIFRAWTWNTLFLLGGGGYQFPNCVR